MEARRADARIGVRARQRVAAIDTDLARLDSELSAARGRRPIPIRLYTEIAALQDERDALARIADGVATP